MFCLEYMSTIYLKEYMVIFQPLLRESSSDFEIPIRNRSQTYVINLKDEIILILDSFILSGKLLNVVYFALKIN